MHCISIQIQSEHLADFNRKDFLTRVRALGRSPEIDSFTEKGTEYLIYNFFTEQPKILWQTLEKELYKNSQYGAIIGPVSVAVCENENDAADFLVLHHFDSTQKIDTFSNLQPSRNP
jgi:hypothetical protein